MDAFPVHQPSLLKIAAAKVVAFCRRLRRRRCILHIGTHKTGTTALQMALLAGRTGLERLGWHYPLAGIPAECAGHHALAWELYESRADGTAGPETARLLEEISRTPHDVILSSEDLECAAYDGSPGFANFIRTLKRRGFRVTVVVYLRNQIDYMRSLYLELLKHGYAEPFTHFLEDGLRQGVVRWRTSTFPLSYVDLLSRLRQCHRGRILVRSYDEAKHSVVDDFCSVLGLTAGEGGLDTTSRANGELSPEESFRLFCANRCGRSLCVPLAALMERAGLPPENVEIGLSEESREQIVRRFGEANQAVVRAFGLRELPMAVRQAKASCRGRLLGFRDIFSEAYADAAVAAAMEAGSPHGH